MKTIEGIEYVELPGGALMPATYVREPMKIRSPADVLPLLSEERYADQERFVVFTLDGSNQVIKKHVVTIGLANQSQIHPRETFRPAIVDGACAILLSHNHPSGNIEPSESDLKATRRIVESSKTIGIPVIDHLIVGRDKHSSLRETHAYCFASRNARVLLRVGGPDEKRRDSKLGGRLLGRPPSQAQPDRQGGGRSFDC